MDTDFVIYQFARNIKEKKQNKNKKIPTQCALDTTICKQTQITLIRHGPSYKQLEVKMNRTSFDDNAFAYLLLMIQFLLIVHSW